MGRHSTGGPRAAALAVAVTLVLVVGSAVAWAVVVVGARPEVASAPSGTTAPGTQASAGSQGTPASSGPASSGPATATDRTTAPGSQTSTSTPSTTTSTGTAAGRAGEALAGCARSLTVGDRLARAAAASARDWTIHTQAQVRLDKGTFTPAQAHAAWDASKARGPADVREFSAAAAAWSRARHGCEGVGAATRGTSLSGRGTACEARHAAVSPVVRTAGKVNAQWAAHLTMMAGKAHSDGASYHRRWLAMVRAAPPALDAYSAAAAGLTRAPRCPAP